MLKSGVENLLYNFLAYVPPCRHADGIICRAGFMLAFLSIMYSFKKEVKGTVLVVLVPKYTLAVTIFRDIYIISLGNSNVLAGDAIKL